MSQAGARLRARRIYRHKLRWLFIFMGALCFVGAMFNLVLGLANAEILYVIVGLLQLPLVGFMFLLARVLRIETSSEGLVYHNMGFYTVRAVWADVERVRGVPLRMMGEVECVVLSRSTVSGWTGLAWALPKRECILTIPLGEEWSSVADLRGDIRHHAPHAIH